jgi:SMC interacting uncharacterized protein involved in chromosome segregation
MFIVSETKRFAVDIEKNEEHMNQLQVSISELKVTLKGLEVLVHRISTNEKAIQEQGETVSQLESFKSKATAISGTVWAVLGLAITIMAIFLAKAE